MKTRYTCVALTALLAQASIGAPAVARANGDSPRHFQLEVVDTEPRGGDRAGAAQLDELHAAVLANPKDRRAEKRGALGVAQ